MIPPKELTDIKFDLLVIMKSNKIVFLFVSSYALCWKPQNKVIKKIVTSFLINFIYISKLIINDKCQDEVSEFK